MAGEWIKVSLTPWDDPFAGELSAESAEFVRQCGRWVLVDVSQDSRYPDVVGGVLREVDALRNEFGSLIGFKVHIGNEQMNIFVHTDDVFVSWGDESLEPPPEAAEPRRSRRRLA